MPRLEEEIRNFRSTRYGLGIDRPTPQQTKVILDAAATELKAVQDYWNVGEVNTSNRGVALSYQYPVPEYAGSTGFERSIGSFPLGGRYYRSYGESILEVGLYDHTKIGRQEGYVCVRADRFDLRPNSDYSRYSHRENQFCPNDWREMVRDGSSDDGKCFPADLDPEQLSQAMHARIVRVLATYQPTPQKLMTEAFAEMEELKKKGLLFNTQAECIKAAMKEELARREVIGNRSIISKFLFPR